MAFVYFKVILMKQSFQMIRHSSTLLKHANSFNLRTAVETHSRIIKLGYGTHSSLVSLLISVYVSCDHLDLACQLLNEFPCWDFDLLSANMIIASFMKIGEIDIARRVFHKMHT
ncbi:unnamed protein product [Ilex paraguariensis]|uniref:Pentatricopeptide repeat-containing protein n=1 Tax=Ilex paraguariensis TaxID=185542 RepID=A0ABC8UB41_9AQUA